MNMQITADLERQIAEAEQELQAKRKQVLELRRRIPPMEVKDHALQGKGGKEVRLSELFDGREQLILVHNMGKSCPYCTLWADNFNGAVEHLNSRAAFVVVSPDAPDVQQEFAEGRGWRFTMVSAQGSTFSKDLGFENEDGPDTYIPGVSVFQMDGQGNITRVARDFFGPGDVYNGVWGFFDLLPEGPNGWEPKFAY